MGVDGSVSFLLATPLEPNFAYYSKPPPSICRHFHNFAFDVSVSARPLEKNGR